MKVQNGSQIHLGGIQHYTFYCFDVRGIERKEDPGLNRFIIETTKDKYILRIGWEKDMTFDIKEYKTKLQMKTTKLSKTIAKFNWGVSIDVCSLVVEYVCGSLIEHIGVIVAENVSDLIPLFGPANGTCFMQPVALA